MEKPRKIKHLLFILPFSLLYSPNVQGQIDTSLIQSKIGEANAYVEERKFESALENYQAVIEVCSEGEMWEKALEVMNLKTGLLRKIGRYQEAETQAKMSLVRSREKSLRQSSAYSNALYLMGTVQWALGRYDSSRKYLNLGLETQSQLPDSTSSNPAKYFLMLGLNEKSSGEYREAIRLYQKALEIYQQKEDWNSISLVYNNLGNVYKNLEEYDLALQYQEKSMKINMEHWGEEDSRLINSYINMGNIRTRLGEFDLALDQFEKALQLSIRTWGERHPRIVSCYNNMGICYYKMGDVGRSADYLKQALEMDKSIRGESHPAIGGEYNNLGLLYNRLGKYKEALVTFDKALEIYQNTYGQNHDLVAQCYNNIGLVMMNMESYEEALGYYGNASDVWLEVFGPEHSARANALHNMGNVWFIQRNFSEALKYYDTAYALRKDSYPRSHKLILSDQLGRAMAYYHLGKEKEAFRGVETALASVTKGYQTGHLLTLPEPDSLVLVPATIEVLFRKAMILHAPDFFNDDLPRLEASLNYYELAIRLDAKLRQNFSAGLWEESVSISPEEIVGQGIKVAMHLAHLTGDKSFIRRAFELSEKGKASQLRLALKNSQARNFAGIPDSLIIFEKRLNYELGVKETRLENLTGSDKELQEEIRLLQEDVFRLKIARDSLILAIEKQYPLYFNLKYSTAPPEITDLQTYLSNKKAAMIEYFWGEDSVYGFLVLPDRIIGMSLLSIDSMDAMIRKFRESLNTYFEPGAGGEDTYNELAAVWTTGSCQLYRHLVFPFETFMAETNNLVIIPDGAINYLPFESFLTTMPAVADAFRTHPYMLKKFRISYQFSSYLLLEKLESDKNSRNLLAFAPSFGEMGEMFRGEKPDEPLPELIYHREEAETIARMWEGDLFVGDNATKSSFITHAPDAGILHLATHGITNEENSNLSYLAFSPVGNDPSSGRLYSGELYGLNLQANMVVMSACETGIGKLVRGEGMTSMAMGFSYAGVKSMIATYWRVNDLASSNLMKSFYKELKSGFAIDHALQTAKLQMIHNGDNYTAHPYFWAGYVVIGSTDPLYRHFSIKNTLVVAFLALLILWLIGSVIRHRGKGRNPDNTYSNKI